MIEAPHASPRAVLEDAATAAISGADGQGRRPRLRRESFNRLRKYVADHAANEVARIVANVVKILQAAREVRNELDKLHGAAFDPVRRDVAQQLGRLVFPGFITPTGAQRLPDVERYLRGAVWRLQRLTRNAAVDRDRQRGINELEDLYRQRLQLAPAGTRVDGELAEVPWLLGGAADDPVRAGPRPQGPGDHRKIRRILDEA